MKKFFVLLGVVALLSGLILISTQKNEDTNKLPEKVKSLTPSTWELDSKNIIRLNGPGSNIDSLDFFEADNLEESLLFVTSKSSNLVEVWKYPFKNGVFELLKFQNSANGVSVDQEENILYVGLREPPSVHALSIPSFKEIGVFGDNDLGSAETNMDIFYGEEYNLIYVTDNNNVYVYRTDSFELTDKFSPPVTSIETVLVDSERKIIYVPEEQGANAKSVGVYAYNVDGTLYNKEGRNYFGNNGIFNSDEEGIALYACGERKGFIIVSDQRGDKTDFEFFDRDTWEHLGTLNIKGVKNTDGIAVTNKKFDKFPRGIFAAIDNDSETILVGFDEIFEAIKLNC